MRSWGYYRQIIFCRLHLLRSLSTSQERPDLWRHVNKRETERKCVLTVLRVLHIPGARELFDIFIVSLLDVRIYQAGPIERSNIPQRVRSGQGQCCFREASRQKSGSLHCLGPSWERVQGGTLSHPWSCRRSSRPRPRQEQFLSGSFTCYNPDLIGRRYKYSQS